MSEHPLLERLEKNAVSSYERVCAKRWRKDVDALAEAVARNEAWQREANRACRLEVISGDVDATPKHLAELAALLRTRRERQKGLDDYAREIDEHGECK